MTKLRNNVHALSGFVTLLVINFVVSYINLPPIEINILNALIAGILGIPGAALLVYMTYFR